MIMDPGPCAMYIKVSIWGGKESKQIKYYIAANTSGGCVLTSLAFDTPAGVRRREGCILLPQHKSNNNNLLITIMHWRRLNQRTSAPPI